MNQKHKRICFIHSPEVYYEQNYGARFTPVWAYTLAAYVPSHWEVQIHDCTVADKSAIPESPLYAFSGINQDFPSIKATYNYLKNKYPGSKFILGGPICWSYEKDNKLKDLEFFDHLFILDGEESFPEFLRQLDAGKGAEIPKVIRAPRFSVGKAKKLRFDLLKPNASKYYGGVVEVSRGCPFLCEFCDIRVLPNNNESHTKDINLIVAELEEYRKLGVRQIQLACDNFIGDTVWARQCVDAILEWVERTGAQMALYTWTTVNISKMPDLLKKMRRAGFTSVFIGVESFNANSILETAKVQNHNARKELIEGLQEIQSYGFIIAPGLIFGFDNDPLTLFDDMLNGVVESGLISGDPTFLLALPGTPLHERMKRTRRLVEDDRSGKTLALHKERISKVQSNIKYLQPREFLIEGFLKFIREFTSPQVALKRFQNHVSTMMESDNFVPVHSIGYGSLPEYFKFQFSSSINIKMLYKRVSCLLRPANLWTVLRAYALVLKYRPRYKGLKNHFTFWLFVWTNLLIKYAGIREEDFKIHSVEHDYDINKLWADLEHTDPDLLPNGRNADNVKVQEQLRSTKKALLNLKETIGASYQPSSFDV